MAGGLVKPAPFHYVRPDSLEEALAVKAEHGDEARPLAGGQSLVPMLNMRLSVPEVLVDLNRIDALGETTLDGGVLRLGASVRQCELERAPLLRTNLPLTAEAARHIGHFVTRNRGTVGGSIAHADARAELPVALTALGGSAILASTHGERVVPAQELFVTHFTTALEPEELLTATLWPAATPGWGFAFEEFASRHGDFALAMVACALHVTDGAVVEASLVAGAVRDVPVVLGDAAGVLAGAAVDDQLSQEAGRVAAAAVDPPDDLHASAAYRRHMVGELTARSVLRAWSDALEKADG
jgi:2-furoyl-CoA dehydrogenase FAD binding subunit